ncbi:hypothetical protein C8R43DRAFT_953564 [Mycena crocata]|nr:hypothetical protein C8R43DRAFT_953564 [Mycena crocata]
MEIASRSGAYAAYARWADGGSTGKQRDTVQPRTQGQALVSMEFEEGTLLNLPPRRNPIGSANPVLLFALSCRAKRSKVLFDSLQSVETGSRRRFRLVESAWSRFRRAENLRIPCIPGLLLAVTSHPKTSLTSTQGRPPDTSSSGLNAEKLRSARTPTLTRPNGFVHYGFKKVRHRFIGLGMVLRAAQGGLDLCPPLPRIPTPASLCALPSSVSNTGKFALAVDP